MQGFCFVVFLKRYFNAAEKTCLCFQDVCVKCIEACNGIVDRSLEHGGWLGRRSPAVLSSPMNNLHTEPHAQSRQDGTYDLI